MYGDIPRIVFYIICGQKDEICVEHKPAFIPVHPWLDLDSEINSYLSQINSCPMSNQGCITLSRDNMYVLEVNLIFIDLITNPIKSNNSFT